MEDKENNIKTTQGEALTNSKDIEVLPIKNKGGRPKGVKDHPNVLKDRKFNQIIELASKNLPASTIAKAVELPVRTVQNYVSKFKKVFKELENVEDYRNAKSDLLDAAQLTVLKNALSDKKLKKASFMSLAQGFEIFNKAGRLEKGLSTDNHAVSQFVKVHLGNILPDKS